MVSNKEEVIKNLKAFAFDVDGVLFPNEVWWFSDDTFMKRRSLYDGQAISLLRAMGIHVTFITSAKGMMAKPIESLIEKWNQLPSSKSELNPDGWAPVSLTTSQNSMQKLATLDAWLKEVGATREECGAMGDDLVDLEMLNVVAFKAAPVQAESVIRERVDFVSTRQGGKGAIRDLVNYIAEVRGIDVTKLPLQ